jgi:hypothetical protein
LKIVANYQTNGPKATTKYSYIKHSTKNKELKRLPILMKFPHNFSEKGGKEQKFKKSRKLCEIFQRLEVLNCK